MEHLFYFWLVTALICLIMEMSSPGLFYFLSFFFGGLCAAIMSLLVDAWILQGVVFLLGTTISLVALKYWIKAHRKNHQAPITNVYALEGKQGIVIADITPEHPGQIKVQGEIWSAITSDQVTIKTGSFVRIVAIGGAYLTVVEINK